MIGTGGDDMLISNAQSYRTLRSAIRKYMPAGLDRGAGWDILIEIFLAEQGGATSIAPTVIEACGGSAETARRYACALEQVGLIEFHMGGDAWTATTTPYGRSVMADILVRPVA
jgi:predicted transcriptional regulator